MTTPLRLADVLTLPVSDGLGHMHGMECAVLCWAKKPGRLPPADGKKPSRFIPAG